MAKQKDDLQHPVLLFVGFFVVSSAAGSCIGWYLGTSLGDALFKKYIINVD